MITLRNSISLPSICLWKGHPLRHPKCLFHETPSSWVEAKTRIHHEEHYALLNVSPDCSPQELKDGFITQAKKFHPDNNTGNADAEKFTLIQEAYNQLQRVRTDDIDAGHDDEVAVILDIRHTAPQHRQYLTFEGVGHGTPSQRQKQYQQHRVIQATETVYEHRVQKSAAGDYALRLKENQAKQNKISQAFDRLVEDLIQEAMSKGEFENLPGKGRPIDFSDRNPHIDTTTHNLNKILVNGGYAPAWIELEREIRNEVSEARKQLAIRRKQMGLPPYSPAVDQHWARSVANFKEVMMKVNVKINKYNFLVPFINKQYVHYNIAKEIQKIHDNHESYLPINQDGILMAQDLFNQTMTKKDQIKWAEVWKHIRAVFQ